MKFKKVKQPQKNVMGLISGSVFLLHLEMECKTKISCVLAGHFLFDVRKERPTYVDQHFFKNITVKRAYIIDNFSDKLKSRLLDKMNYLSYNMKLN